jgi:hypothetical protein
MNKFTCNYMSKISVTMHLLKMNEYKINELGIQCIVQGFSFQFCDIGNLPNFSKKIVKITQIYTRGKNNPQLFPFFLLGKNNKKIVKIKTTCVVPSFFIMSSCNPFLCWSLEPHIITSSSLVCKLKFNINVINLIWFFWGHASFALLGTQDCK